MVAYSRFQALIGSVAPVGGALAGLGVAAACLLVPADTLETMVWNSGIAALIPAAAPPLGTTARLTLAFGSGFVAAAVTWSALFLLFGPGGFLASRVRVPVRRRADAHPDDRVRAPMKAADLGTPLMEVSATRGSVRVVQQVNADRPWPVDLDQPLAAFDPEAVPAAPREPARPVAPLATPRAMPVTVTETAPTPTVPPLTTPPPTTPSPPALAPGERLDTFRPMPAVPPATAQRHDPVPAQTIESLLRRLEESAGRRAARA